MPSYPQRPAVMAAIAAHLREVGPRDWERITTRFDEVPPRTMWRWIREVKKAPDAHEVVVAAVEQNQSPVANQGAYPRSTISDLDGCHPLAASIRKLTADAELLRSSSLNPDGSIKNVRAFERSAKLRLEVYSRFITLREVLEYDHRCWSIIAEGIMEVHAEDVAASHRIMAKLQKLRELYEGLTA